MADGATASSGSANGTWAINSSSITVASTSGTIEVGQEVTGTGIPTMQMLFLSMGLLLL